MILLAQFDWALLGVFSTLLLLVGMVILFLAGVYLVDRKPVTGVLVMVLVVLAMATLTGVSAWMTTAGGK